MSDQQREPSCDCIEKAEVFLKERNTELDLLFSLDGTRPDRVVIGTLLIEKKRGAKPMRMAPNYCPFCGVRYGWKDQPVSAEVAS